MVSVLFFLLNLEIRIINLEKLAEYATGTAVDALEQAETNVTNLDELLSSAPNDLLELAKTLLVLDPNKRSSSADAIMHSSLNK